MMTVARGDLVTDAGYAALQSWLDVDNFADYMLLNLTLGNADWPEKNWLAARRRNTDALWRFIPTDGEMTMGYITSTYTDATWPDGPGELFQLLRTNSEFRVRFGDRVQKHLFEDGPLSTDELLDRWEDLSDTAWPALAGESARWGDHWRDVRGAIDAELYTYDAHWETENARMRNDFFPRRLTYVLADFKAKGLFPTLEAPEADPEAGRIDMGDPVSLDAHHGAIWFTTDGSDPRLPGGAVSPTAARYSNEIPIDHTQVVSARVLAGHEWSALTQAQYTVR